MHSKGWMIAGATAGLLLSSATRATESPGGNEQPDPAAHLSQPGATPNGDAGAGADPSGERDVRRAGSGYGARTDDESSRGDTGRARAKAPSAAERAARFDAAELAAGNTGGRG